MDKIVGKKILYVFEYFPPVILGGAEISGPMRARELTEDNVVVVLTPNYEKKEWSIKKESGLTVIHFPSLRLRLFKRRKSVSQKVAKKARRMWKNTLLFFALVSAFEFRRVIRRVEREHGPFDIIHSNNSESSLAVALAKTKAKKIAHFRDTIFFDDVKESNWLRKTVIRWLKHCDEFMVNSKFMGKKCAAILGVPVKECIVVYNTVSEDQISRKSKVEARALLNIGQEERVVVSGSSLTREKGMDTLVFTIAPQCSDCSFYIIGDGYLRDELKKNAPSNVHLLGKVPYEKVKLFFRAADITVVPSQWDEPLGRVSLEAQANGSFALVTKKGGLPETVDGIKGKAVDIEEFPKEIKRFLKESKSRK